MKPITSYHISYIPRHYNDANAQSMTIQGPLVNKTNAPKTTQDLVIFSDYAIYSNDAYELSEIYTMDTEQY